MITNRAMTTANDLVQSLVDGNKYVQAVDGSLLSDLISTNIAADVWARASTPEVQLDANRIVTDSQQRSPDDIAEHDELMEQGCERIAEIVRGNLVLARHEVIPQVKAVHEKYQQQLNYIEADAKTPVTIVPNVYHELWGKAQLHGMVSRFRDVAVNPYTFSVSLPKLNGAELNQMIYTGISDLDEAIEDWLADMPSGKLIETYERVFVNLNTSIGRPTTAEHLTPDQQNDRNDLLLTYLIARGYENHLPDGIQVPLADLRNYLSRMIEQAGRAVAAEIDRRERDIRHNVMIYSIRSYDWEFSSDGRMVVRVNNDVYRKYLDKGGTPEAVYGTAVNGGPRDPETLIEQKDQLESKWLRYLGLHNQRLSAQMFTAERDAARIAMTQVINEEDDDNLPAQKSDLHHLTSQVLGKLQPKDFEDEWNVLRCLVCDVLYADSNVKMVLDAMDSVELANPDLNARECALFATIDLMARWLAAQITIHYN